MGCSEHAWAPAGTLQMLPLGATERSAWGAPVMARGWRFRRLVGLLVTCSGLAILIDHALYHELH